MVTYLRALLVVRLSSHCMADAPDSTDVNHQQLIDRANPRSLS